MNINSLWSYISHSSTIKSLAFRALAFGAVAVLASINSDLIGVGANPAVVSIVGLIAGEGTQALNAWIKQNPLPQD